MALLGLESAWNEEFELVILDLMLPGVDGFEICRQIREVKNIPIIMVSAKKDDIDKIRGLGLGADDYMTKPFSPSELVARVKAHLNRYERLVEQQCKGEQYYRDPRHQDRQNGSPGLGQRGRKELHFPGIRSADLPGGESEPRIYQGRTVPGKSGIWIPWEISRR